MAGGQAVMPGGIAVMQIRVAMLRGGAAVMQIVGAAPPAEPVVIQTGRAERHGRTATIPAEAAATPAVMAMAPNGLAAMPAEMAGPRARTATAPVRVAVTCFQTGGSPAAPLAWRLFMAPCWRFCVVLILIAWIVGWLGPSWLPPPTLSRRSLEPQESSVLQAAIQFFVMMP
jgi:hypothetical protein